MYVVYYYLFCIIYIFLHNRSLSIINQNDDYYYFYTTKVEVVYMYINNNNEDYNQLSQIASIVYVRKVKLFSITIHVVLLQYLILRKMSVDINLMH